MKPGWTKLTAHSARTTALTLACLLVSGVAWADTFIDPLDNWNKAEAHSPGVVLDNSNPSFFFGDTSRAKCEGSAVASFYYHLPNITSFSVLAFNFSYEGTIEVYVSPDKATWTRIDTTASDPQPTTPDTSTGSWRFSKIVPSGALPAGMNYIGFTMRNDQQNQFTPQIGQVTINYRGAGGDDEVNSGPQGLSILSGSGQALLAWYPVPGALTYTIKRKSVGASKYEVVATGVTSTYYLDKELDNGGKYYYAVIAETKQGTTDRSDEVLAAPKNNIVIFHDPLTDWSLASAHSANLTLASFGGSSSTDSTASAAGQEVKRTSNTRESITYNVPGASTIDFNVYSAQSDPSNAVAAEVSADGSTWTPISLAFNLPARIGPRCFASVCSPDAPLPKGTCYIRLDIGADGMPADSPQIADVRIAGSGDSK